MAKFSSFFHLSASCVSPFLVCFLLMSFAFGAFLSLGAVLGLEEDLSPFGRDAGTLPGSTAGASPFLGKESMVGLSTPTAFRNWRRSDGTSAVLASFRNGWEWILDMLMSASSKTNTMSLSVLFMMDSGPTHPFLHPNFSIRSFSSARRRFTLPSSFNILPNSFVFISASVHVVTKKNPCFLSLKNRFLVCDSLVSEGSGTLATSSSAVMERAWEYVVWGMERVFSFSTMGLPVKSMASVAVFMSDMLSIMISL
mmetsp:Transcript_42073/g.75881  ORF Transcript_42073/g.75881 Transcript_42073/m.75881 type:complete len:254 (-) Transcript_42073:241-1002(-)